MKRHFLHIIIVSFVFSCALFAQEKEVEDCLKKIELGKSDSSKVILKGLLKRYPLSASVLFLDGVLTADGKEALVKYLSVVDNNPDSKYADAALYRIYSYYYALGNYEKAKKYLQKLKTSYPKSPYIKTADPSYQNQIDDTKQSYTHTIQAGAFINKANAKELRTELEEEGYVTEMKEKSLGGTMLHIVYAGKFYSEKEAEEALAKINKDYRLDGRVIAVKK